MEGQGDLVSESIMGITRVTMWGIGVITLSLVTKSPDPPSNLAGKRKETCSNLIMTRNILMLFEGTLHREKYEAPATTLLVIIHAPAVRDSARILPWGQEGEMKKGNFRQ